jgi:hypothetical protein
MGEKEDSCKSLEEGEGVAMDVKEKQEAYRGRSAARDQSWEERFSCSLVAHFWFRYQA